MGVRFNKRMKILPYVTMNVGKSGVSLTIGPKGKTLNIGSTGVNVYVSLGKGVGYSKRLITWKKLNLLSMLGLGGTAAKKANKAPATTTTKGATRKGKKGSTTVPSLDEAIADAEEAANNPSGTPGKDTPDTLPEGVAPQEEQPGCGPVGCIIGIFVVLIILGLIAAVVYLLMTRPEVAATT